MFIAALLSASVVLIPAAIAQSADLTSALAPIASLLQTSCPVCYPTQIQSISNLDCSAAIAIDNCLTKQTSTGCNTVHSAIQNTDLVKSFILDCDLAAIASGTCNGGTLSVPIAQAVYTCLSGLGNVRFDDCGYVNNAIACVSQNSCGTAIGAIRAADSKVASLIDRCTSSGTIAAPPLTQSASTAVGTMGSSSVSTPSSSSSGGMSSGIIAGIAAGGGVLLIGAIVLTVIFLRCGKSGNANKSDSAAVASAAQPVSEPAQIDKNYFSFPDQHKEVVDKNAAFFATGTTPGSQHSYNSSHGNPSSQTSLIASNGGSQFSNVYNAAVAEPLHQLQHGYQQNQQHGQHQPHQYLHQNNHGGQHQPHQYLHQNHHGGQHQPHQYLHQNNHEIHHQPQHYLHPNNHEANHHHPQQYHHQNNHHNKQETQYPHHAYAQHDPIALHQQSQLSRYNPGTVMSDGGATMVHGDRAAWR